MSTFANNLTNLMAKNNLSITELAKKTEITYNMIKKYCTGQADATLNYAKRLAHALNVSIDDLIDHDAPEPEKTMFEQVFEEDFTYIKGFMRSVRRYKDKVAVIDPICDLELTYTELNGKVNQFANALLDNGVEEADLVTYLLPNSLEFILSYLAPQKLGAVTNPANFNFSAGETAVCLDTSKPKVFIYDSANKDTMITALNLAYHKPSIVLMVGEGDVPQNHQHFFDFIESYPTSEPLTSFKPHIYDEVMRLFTSGTTGKPKGVPVLNANEVLSCHDVIMHFPLNTTDTTMNTTPWFHRGGIHSGGPSPTFYAGGTVVIMHALSPQNALSYAEKHKVSFIIGVPSIIKMLLRKQEKFGADLSHVKGIVTMGAPFERTDCIKVQNLLSKNIFNGYGTTETFWNTFLRPYDLPERAGSAGSACTDDDVRVIKLREDRVEPDDLASQNNSEVGEVIIRTPKSSYSYIDNLEEQKNKFYKGFMYTGDLATWDKDGYITIQSRKDDMLISGGENIYPPIIEEVLNAHPKVKMSAVVGVPDAIRGEAVTAYIIAEDESLTAHELAKFCMQSDMLSVYKRPRYYRFVKELPMTATGKIQHFNLREIAIADLEAGLLKMATGDK